MKTRPIAAALLLALAPVTFQTAVFAQAAAEDPTTAMARARFKEGVEFYDKGEFEQARAAFLQAYALKKHPAVLLNLAWSSLKSGHALEAEKEFKQFLTEGKDITDKQRADANDGLTQSHNKLGRIEISAVPGTEVTIDGEKIGTTPLTDAIPVEAGAHTVKFKGADGATDTQSVSVLGGEKALAKYGKMGALGPAVSTTTTTTTGNPPTEPTPPPPPTKPPPEEENPKPPPPPPPPPPEQHGSGPNLIPVVALGVVAAASFVIGGVVGIAQKQQAQNKANQVADEIRANIPAGRTSAGICTNPPTNFAQACADYVSDNNQVNQDATAGNILLGVGIAALVGAGVYYIVAPRGSAEHGANKPVHVDLTPVLGRSTTGLSLTGTF